MPPGDRLAGSKLTSLSTPDETIQQIEDGMRRVWLADGFTPRPVFDMSTSSGRTRARLWRCRRRRAQLVRVLAPDLRCANCGRACEVGELHVDHVDGITWDRSKVSPQMRVARYVRELAAGVRLRALCGHCSMSDGARRLNAKRALARRRGR